MDPLILGRGVHLGADGIPTTPAPVPGGGVVPRRPYARPARPLRFGWPSTPEGLLWLALALAAALPLLLVAFPPFYDYYHWLFAGQLVADFWRGGPTAAATGALYRLDVAPVPNLAAPVGIGLLNLLFPLELAGRLFLVACVLAFAGGFAFLVRSVQQRPTAVEALGLPWACGYFLAKGYLSYLLALALAFIALGLLQHSTGGAAHGVRRRAWAGLAALSVAVYLAHLLGWAVFALGVGVYAGGLWRRGARRAAGALLGVLTPALALLGWYGLTMPAGSLLFFYQTAVDKLLSLVEPWQLFLRPDPFPPLVPVFLANAGGLTLVGGIWLAQLGRRPRLRPQGRALLGVSLLLGLGALLLPVSQMGELIRPDERLLLPAVLLALVPWQARAGSGRRNGLAAGILLLILGLHCVEWQRASAGTETIDTATDAVIPPQAAVLSVTIYAWEVKGACTSEPLGISVGAATLRWIGLDRLAEAGGGATNLMATSLVAPRATRPPGAALTAEVRTREDLRAQAPLGPPWAAHYGYVELFGCPADIAAARQAIGAPYRLATQGPYFAVLRRAP